MFVLICTRTSERIYPVVERVIASAECNSDIGQGWLVLSLSLSLSQTLTPFSPPAISYECIRTVAKIYPNNSVVSKTAKCLSRFVTSTNNNWRYLGINGLASIVQVHCTYNSFSEEPLNNGHDETSHLQGSIQWGGGGGGGEASLPNTPTSPPNIQASPLLV